MNSNISTITQFRRTLYNSTTRKIATSYNIMNLPFKKDKSIFYSLN